jgi:hypothetical protein
MLWPAIENHKSKIENPFGAVAQLGERLVCNQEVVGSNPIGSTMSDIFDLGFWIFDFRTMSAP